MLNLNKIQKRNNIVGTMLLCFILILLGGCSNTLKIYPGPKLPKEKTAYIKTFCLDNWCYEVDGKKIYNEDGVYILPGPHQITIMWKGKYEPLESRPVNNVPGLNAYAGRHFCTLNFKAVAGKNYTMGRSKITTDGEGACSRYKYIERKQYGDRIKMCVEKVYDKFSAKAYIRETESGRILDECSIGLRKMVRGQ